MVVRSPVVVDKQLCCNDCYARAGSEEGGADIRRVELRVKDERGGDKTVAMSMAAEEGHVPAKEQRLTVLVLEWERHRAETDRSAQVVRGKRRQVPFPRDWGSRSEALRKAYLAAFNGHMVRWFVLYNEKGDLVFEVLEVQRGRTRALYLTMYPGEMTELIWNGVELVYTEPPAPLQPWHDDEVKPKEMQVGIFCTPSKQATMHYCYEGDALGMLRVLRDRVVGNKGVVNSIFEAALQRNGDLAAVTAANSREELMKVVKRPMFPAGVAMRPGHITGMSDAAVIHGGPPLVAGGDEPVRVFIAAQCIPASLFDPAKCEDAPGQIDGLTKMAQLGLDGCTSSIVHLQEQLHDDEFYQSRGAEGLAAAAARETRDVARVWNPLFKSQANALPQTGVQRGRHSAAQSEIVTLKPHPFVTVHRGIPAPAFKLGHEHVFDKGYLSWGHTGDGYAKEVLHMAECGEEGVVIRPCGHEDWTEFYVYKGDTAVIEPGFRGRWLDVGTSPTPATKLYSYFDKDGKELHGAGVAEGKWEIRCDICGLDCWCDSYELEPDLWADLKLQGRDVCVPCFGSLTRVHEGENFKAKVKKLAFGRAWREPIEPAVSLPFWPMSTHVEKLKKTRTPKRRSSAPERQPPDSVHKGTKPKKSRK